MNPNHISKDAVAAKTGLDPEARNIVELLATLEPMYKGTAEEARLARESRKNPFAMEERELAKIEDFEIQTRSGSVPARLYQPLTSRSGPLPGLLFFHGGGFVLGSIETHDTIAQHIAAAAECIVISVGYRLSPETKFPGAVQDAVDSFRSIFQQAADFGINDKKLAIGGDSAGANLAAVTCLLNRDEGKPSACFQLLLYPTTHILFQAGSKQEFCDGPFLDLPTMKWFNSQYVETIEQCNDFKASPLLAENHTSLPPAHIITAGFDPLRDEGKAYADKLNVAGVTATHSCYTDMFHGFLSFGKGMPQAQAAIDEIGQVLKQFFGSC